MNDLRFIKYQETPNEKYVGIMTIMVKGIILRYKIVKTKDGNSLFPAAASYKINEGDEDKYINAFCMDSQSEQELLMDFLKEKISAISAAKHQKSNTIDDLVKNGQSHHKNSIVQPDRSNAELDTNDDLPF